MVDSLLSLVDLDKVSSDPRKCLREREIRKSEERVTRLMQVMKEDFINPFDANIDKQELFNLASGRPLSEEASSSLLSAEERGQIRYEEFNQRLDINDESSIAFFDPIKRVPWRDFGNNERKTKVTAKGKSKDVTVQRDILGILVATSYKEKSMIDIDKALSFPLAPVPLSLATADGMRRKTAKSKLLEAALSSTITDLEYVDDATCYVVDLVATIRSTVRIPDTFRELAFSC